MERQKTISILLVIAVFAVVLFAILRQKSQVATLPPTKFDLQDNTNKIAVDEIGLTFEYPKELTFRKEVAADGESIRSLGFYVEQGSGVDIPYTLYGLFQFQKAATENDLDLARTEMDPETVMEITVDGYKGVEGFIDGQKTRYSTVILKDDNLFSVSTFPPTAENKSMTDQIIASFDFE